MLKKIIAGYGQTLLFLLKICLLFLLCVAAGAAVVFPLWKFATIHPALYSAAVCAAAAAALVLFLTAKLRRYLHAAQTAAERAARIKKLVFGICRAVIVLGGVIGCVILVLHHRRAAALFLAGAAIAVYGVLTYGTADARRR
ncbi:MAG TPA: hypothetical protein IAA30_01340 [Candidatus Treponema faecavium]|nr:hypothetical protein [Candidatus Treponema faecavium]